MPTPLSPVSDSPEPEGPRGNGPERVCARCDGPLALGSDIRNGTHLEPEACFEFLVATVANLRQELAAVSDSPASDALASVETCWQEATGCKTPAQFIERVQLRKFGYIPESSPVQFLETPVQPYTGAQGVEA